MVTSSSRLASSHASSRSEEHTSELQSPCNLVCRLLLEKKKHHVQLVHTDCDIIRLHFINDPLKRIVTLFNSVLSKPLHDEPCSLNHRSLRHRCVHRSRI